MSESKLMSSVEVAALLGISRTTLRAIVKRGQLRQIGGRRQSMFDASQVREFLSSLQGAADLGRLRTQRERALALSEKKRDLLQRLELARWKTTAGR